MISSFDLDQEKTPAPFSPAIVKSDAFQTEESVERGNGCYNVVSLGPIEQPSESATPPRTAVFAYVFNSHEQLKKGQPDLLPLFDYTRQTTSGHARHFCFQNLHLYYHAFPAGGPH